MASLLKIKNQVMKTKAVSPWNLLDPAIQFDGSRYSSALRDNNNLPAIKLYQAAITAARHFVNRNEQNADLFPYRLVRSMKGSNLVYALELCYNHTDRLVMTYEEGEELLITNVALDQNGAAAYAPLTAWNQVPDLTHGILLLLIPHMLKMENVMSDDGLEQAMTELETQFDAALQCAAKTDFDPDTVENLYFLSVIVDYLDKMEVKLNGSGLPDSILDLEQKHPKGKVLSQNQPEKIKYVDSTGTANRHSTNASVTMKEAIYCTVQFLLCRPELDRGREEVDPQVQGRYACYERGFVPRSAFYQHHE